MPFCGWGRVAEGGGGVPPLTLEGLQGLSVCLSQLENHATDIGPQLSDEEIGCLVAQAKSAEREMRARAAMTKEEQAALALLQDNLLAVHYRHNHDAGYRGNPLTHEERGALEERLLALRQSPEMCPGFDAFTDKDLRQIEALCLHYPDYARHLLTSEADCETFFKWALRSQCDIAIVIQFPSMARRLMSCHADKRFGVIEEGLRVNPDGFVEMKVFGGYATGAARHQGASYVSLHDPKARIALTSRVNALARPYVVTIGDIFKALKEKTTKYGYVEVLNDGLSNWDAIRQGSFNPQSGRVDRFDAGRWMEMPPVAVVSLEQIRARFPDQRIDAEGVKFAICASRRHLPTQMGPRVDDTHAYLCVFVPNADGTYNELSMGLQPYDLPKNKVDKLWYVGSTKPAEVHLIDESRYLSHREHKGVIYDLTPDQTALLQGHIEHEIEKGRSGRKTFSPQGNNCANFDQKALWKVLIDPLLFDPLDAIAEAHSNHNLSSYLRGLKRATKAGNEGARKKYAERIVGQLKRADLITLIQSSHSLQVSTLYKDHPGDLPQLNREALQKANLQQLRSGALELFLSSLKSTQIFPMRTLDLDTSKDVFNYINRTFRLLVTANIVSQTFVAGCYQVINFVLFFSWRFSTTLKSLVTNKYSQAGMQAIPAGMWVWHERVPAMEKEIGDRIRHVNALPPESYSA